jgi:hypothetical protein
MSLEEDLKEAVNRIKTEIMDNREEILRAFISKYGWQPEECEQVLDMSDYASGVIRWSVRKKGGGNGKVDRV